MAASRKSDTTSHPLSCLSRHNRRMKRLHLLKPGTFTDAQGVTVTLSAQDMAAIATSYNAALHEAPIVVGHPKSDAPAFGWIQDLAADQTGLHGTPRQVDAEFAELVREGKYKKLSVSLYGPAHHGNPTPGNWHLRHVGFLGAMPPVVKGLSRINFAEDDPSLVVEVDFSEEKSSPMPWVFGSIGSNFRRIRDWLIGEKGLEVADRVMPNYRIREIEDEEKRMLHAQQNTTSLSEQTNNPETDDMTGTTEGPNKQADFAEREADLARRETELAEREQQAYHQDAADFAEQLVSEGRVLPRDKDALAKLLTLIPADAKIEFAEGQGQNKAGPADQFFRQFLSALPVRVDYHERTPSQGDLPQGAPVPLKVPLGYTADGTNTELHNKAVAFAEAHNVDYLDAVLSVSNSASISPQQQNNPTPGDSQ